MSPLLASTALGLVAAWPVGALGLGLGRLVERLTGDPRPRAAAWSLAHALPASALAATVALTLAPTPGPGEAARGGDTGHRLTTALALPVGGPLAVPAWRPPPALVEGAAWSLLALSGAGLAARVTVGLRGRRRLSAIRAAASPASDPALIEAVAGHAARLCVTPPPVLISDSIAEPLLVGARRPAILLPAPLADAKSLQALPLVCAHELAHLRRGDNWRLPVEDALAGLFWLAPPAGALRRRMAAAREAVCDLVALDGAPARARHDYARLLVDALRANALPAPQSAFTGRQRSLVEMRLSAILQPRQAASPARLALALAVGGALTAITGAGSLALAREAKAKIATPAQPATVAEVSSVARIQAAPPKTVASAPVSDAKAAPVSASHPARSKEDAPTSTGIEITSDREEASADRTKVTFSGSVTVRGDFAPSAYTLRINGEPAPADLRIETLPDGAIQRLEVITPKATGDGKYAFNVTLSASNP